MVKKWMSVGGILLLSLHVAQAQLVVLYTNAPAGSTVTLSNAVVVAASRDKTNDTAVIAFDLGIGTLEGTGGIVVVSEATNHLSGAFRLAGVVATNALTTADYTGAISVQNNLSAFAVTSSTSTHANAMAVGILGSVTGDLSSDFQIEALAGFSGSETNFSEANAEAYGVTGELNGDLLGTMVLTAVSGTATSGLGRASAYAISSAIGDDLNGNLEGSITVEALAGTAITESNSSVFAWAEAVGVGSHGDGTNGVVSGTLNGSVSATALGGQANSLGQADAYANATGINRLETGNMSGRIEAQAFGGNAVSDAADATATAEAFGIARGVEGNILETASISARAYGGQAVSVNGAALASAIATGVGGESNEVSFASSGQITATAAGGSAQSDSGSADATAKAYALANGDVSGVLGGTLTATAQGTGTATVTGTGLADASTEAYGVKNGSVGNILGSVLVSATGGTAQSGSDAFANATAYGIEGGMHGDTMSGTLEVSAMGGRATGTSSALASALAVGISGGSMNISNYTGAITATALGGEQDGVANAGRADAIGIEATSDLILNVFSGSIVAIATGSNTTAHAILGGTGADTVTLANAKIIGDIDLRGGGNLLTVNGNTSLDGDIKSTGGTVNFRVENAMLFLSSPVQVSDLAGGTMFFAGDSELTVALTGDPSSPANSKLMVDGSVSATDGLGINASPSAISPAGGSILGKQYAVIESTTGITGTFTEGSHSLFTLDVVSSNNSVWVTATGIQPQVGANTPSVANVEKALVQTFNAGMDDISSHIGTVRTVLRNPSAAGDQPAQPEGAHGPAGRDDVQRKLKMEAGDWVGYVLQVNHLGSQDSSGETAGYNWNTHGFIVGGERLINQRLLLGGAVGGLWSNINGDLDAAGGRSGLGLASVYADWIADAWYTELGLSYGDAKSDSERVDTTGQHYKGSFNSALFGTWIEGGYTIDLKTVEIEPYGRGVYVSGHHDEFTDAGGFAPLTIDESTTDNLTAEFGLRGRKWWNLENGNAFWLSLKGGWRNELLDTTVITSGTIAGAPQYVVSPESDSTAVVLGIKAEWVSEDRALMSINYEPVISGNWFYHSINFDMSYRF